MINASVRHVGSSRDGIGGWPPACENLTGASGLQIGDSNGADRMPARIPGPREAVADCAGGHTAHVHIPAETAGVPITAVPVTDEQVRRVLLALHPAGGPSRDDGWACSGARLAALRMASDWHGSP